MSAGPVVALRAETPDDEDLLFRLASDLDSWEERNPQSPAPVTLAKFRARRANPDIGHADVEFVITADGVAVGRCTLFHEDGLARHAEVGIGLLAEARGRGIGTAALGQLVEFGFVRRNLRRLYLGVIASNAPAIASYRKVGFLEEGRLREHCWVRGQYVDEIKMGLLRSDWQAARR